MSKFYTGVGSRFNVPSDILKFMTKTAYDLANLNYILRSGGAKGCDTAFAAGAGHAKRIYRPRDSTPECEVLAMSFHPYPDKCNKFVKQLQGRNVKQCIGDNLSKPIPSEFLICWTPDGCNSLSTRTGKSGGTATAICVSEHFKIPIFNLQRQGEKEKLYEYINNLEGIM